MDRAEQQRGRDEWQGPDEDPPEPVVVQKPKKVPTAKKKGPSQLERIEAEIASREEQVAELERLLAEDWSDVDTVAAHRRVRDELQSLLSQWEELFESSR